MDYGLWTGSVQCLQIAQKNNYTLMVYITFSTGVHVPKSQLYCAMAVVLTVG